MRERPVPVSRFLLSLLVLNGGYVSMEQIVEFIGNNILLFVFLAAIVTMLVITEYRQFTRGYKEISPAEAVQLMNREGALLLDTQTDNEIGKGRIKGAKHLPVDVLEQRLGELEKYRDKPVIAYCSNGQRSPQACTLLQKNAFQRVYCLKGGLQAWREANLPVAAK